MVIKERQTELEVIHGWNASILLVFSTFYISVCFSAVPSLTKYNSRLIIEHDLRLTVMNLQPCFTEMYKCKNKQVRTCSTQTHPCFNKTSPGPIPIMKKTA